jgi:hypothetical protein
MQLKAFEYLTESMLPKSICVMPNALPQSSMELGQMSKNVSVENA